MTNLRGVGIVYGKELRETLRDRRTLLIMVLLPFALYPMVMFGLAQWLGAQEVLRQDQVSHLGLTGTCWPELQRFLAQQEKLQVVCTGGEPALRSGKLEALVQVPPEPEQRIQRNESLPLILIFDEASASSVLARDRIREALEAFAGRLRQQRLTAHHLPSTLVRPLATTERSIATGQEVGAHMLAGVLPLLVVLMIMLGTFYPAIDLTAGEQERGTLETLLSTPIHRTSLMAGKFLAVATIAVCSGLLNLCSIGLTFAAGLGLELKGTALPDIALPWWSLVITVIALFPTALFFAAVMLAVAALARSFKSAQHLLTPLYLACLLPALIVQLPGAQLTYFSALIPVANITLVLRDLILGPVNWGPLLIALCSLLLYTAGALKLAAWIYNSEWMLYSQPEPTSMALAAPSRRTFPEPLEAGLLFLFVLVALVLVGRLLQSLDLIWGILITEWVLIALPVLVLLKRQRLDARAVLSLRSTGFLSLLGATITGLSGWYLVGVVVEAVQQQILPMPQELIDQTNRLLFGQERPLLLDLFALALSPAICEELLFRGVLLRTAQVRLRCETTVLLNGFFFGLFHLDIYRFMPTFLLGLVLALIVLRTGSILPAMVFHFLNNSAALVIGRLAMVESPEANLSASWPLTVLALTVFIGGFMLLWRGRLQHRSIASS